jgi:UDP-glucose 4-epimerase
LELAQRVIGAAASRSVVEHQTYAAAFDADFEDIRHRVPDLSRLRATINYRRRYDLDRIIAELVAIQAKH